MGWKEEEADRLLSQSIASIHPGDYQRVVSLMEKSLYGEIDLEPFEVRAIYVSLWNILPNMWKSKISG